MRRRRSKVILNYFRN